MANVINKTTLEYKKSVNTPDYPVGDWIINPILPKCEKKYWKITGNQVKEMTATEKKAVDDAEIEAQKEITKENYIEQEKRELAIESLKTKGILDSKGDLIE